MMLCPIVPTTIVTSFMTASVKRFERFERLERFEPVPEFNSFYSSFIPPPSSFALDIHPMHIPASRSGRRSRLKNRIKPRQIFKLREQSYILFDVAWLKTRMIDATVAVAHVFEVMHDAGEESPPERRISHEAHVELTTGLNVPPLG